MLIRNWQETEMNSNFPDINRGVEREDPMNQGAYRYVTFVCIKNYNVGTSRINVAELTFFGTPEDKIIQ